MMILTDKLNRKCVTWATVSAALACALYLSINASGIPLCPIPHFEKSLYFIEGSSEDVPSLWGEKFLNMFNKVRHFYCYTIDHAPKRIVTCSKLYLTPDRLRKPSAATPISHLVLSICRDSAECKCRPFEFGTGDWWGVKRWPGNHTFPCYEQWGPVELTLCRGSSRSRNVDSPKPLQ